ncbi:hypothetical protein [Mycolicibacterium xanthum]|uniref:hypothetical protein n=1 Tax=Mycolicibacterium xanthum TaxID=2796469 RepID=UPI002107BA81|nr:hypothetical protein [Mycolicibacterium xanthum]
MALPALVLVHGGGHAADCWDLTIDEVARLAPEPNGMSSSQRRFNLERLVDESTRVISERVSRQGMPADVPRTWILTGRDRALAPKAQRKSIEALGGVQTSSSWIPVTA